MGDLDYNLLLRTHPAENIGKYDILIASIGIDIEISTNKELCDDLLRAEIVVGCKTMAMVLQRN